MAGVSSLTVSVPGNPSVFPLLPCTRLSSSNPATGGWGGVHTLVSHAVAALFLACLFVASLRLPAALYPKMAADNGKGEAAGRQKGERGARPWFAGARRRRRLGSPDAAQPVGQDSSKSVANQ